MKVKIITAIICMMLLTTFFAVANNVKDLDSKKINNDTQQLLFEEVEVPVWETGDSWTFNIANMEFIIEDENISENLTIEINAQIGEFTLEVVDDSGDTYQVGILETTIDGDFYLETNLGDGPILVTGQLEDTTLLGNLYFNKSDLGIVQFEGTVDGKLTVDIQEQPYFNKSIFPQIPIPATINIDVAMDNPLPIIHFPLNTSFLVWGIPALNATFGGTIESLWLNIFNFINQKIRQWNLIGLIATILGVDPQPIQDVSDIIDDILPVIDIEYVLQEYLGVENVLPIPEIPFIFYCNETAEITIPAGTFETYVINVAGGLGTIYYSPEVKNIIKMEGDFGEALPFLNDINAELTGYT